MKVTPVCSAGLWTRGARGAAAFRAAFLVMAMLGIGCSAYGQEVDLGRAPVAGPQSSVQHDNALSTSKPDEMQLPEANPARPTVSNPAHIPPVGYVQTEQGFLIATASPDGLRQQASLVQSTKLSVDPRLMMQVLSQPVAFSRSSITPGIGSGMSSGSRDAGDLMIGVQGLLALGAGRRPTIALGYNQRVRAGSAPDVDLGSYSKEAVLLVSGDLGESHFDSNCGVSEQVGDGGAGGGTIRRAQFTQSLSVTRDLLPGRRSHDLEVTGELWHVTQPLVASDRSGAARRSNHGAGALVAVGYSLRPNLVFDGGFDHGLTATSTEWQGFAGLTYLFPHRLWAPTAAAGRHHGRRHRR